MSEGIGKGFNLVMELRDPGRLPELMDRLKTARPRIEEALASLDYVHYSRFLPLWSRGLLLIVTEFDGAMKDYVLDFAVVLDQEFSLILSFMKGYDPKHLPVSHHPEAFWAYVDQNTGPKTVDPNKPFPPPYPDPFSAYAGLTALEIAGPLRAKRLPAAPPRDSEPKLPLEDVQAHVLRSYKAACALHLGFEFRSVESGRKMLRQLQELVSTERTAREHKVCVTLGLTHAGLQALDLPQSLLERFPVAFREGPRVRSERLGDIGRSDPLFWQVAGYEPESDNGGPRAAVVVHGMVSVYSSEGPGALDAHVRRVREVVDPMAQERFRLEPKALDGRGEIHFGYRDGIGQPRFADALEPQDKLAAKADATRAEARNDGPHGAGAGASSAPTPPGDLLLGPKYRNSRGGYYIGELPTALATNGTYAALRVIEQDVEAFEELLLDVKAQHGIDPELFAAKLVGRWRNGLALAKYPDAPAKKDIEAVNKMAASMSAAALDAFDYAAPQADFDDREGRRCPFGAHIRRLNPRGGMVLGVPWGRRVVRRGMPYGPKLDPDPKKRVAAKRGLVGLFLCGDLESQFEFIQHVWANQGLSAPGLRQTHDPFGSAHALGTPFRFRPKEAEAEISVMLPPLTRTDGSVYLFMPGLQGLKWLAAAGWNDTARNATSKTSKAAPMDKLLLDATAPSFLDNPYPKYTELRERAPVGKVAPPYDTYWVFSHRLVAEVNRRDREFLKPGGDRTGGKSGPFSVLNQLKDGLFFMDPDRHGEVRPVMNGVFDAAIAKAHEYAEAAANDLLDQARPKGQVDAIGGYAGPLASRVFFQVMGVPQNAWALVDTWVRTALAAHRETMLPEQRGPGASAGLAMRTYFRALQLKAAKDSPGSILAGMQAATGCPHSATTMDPDEAMNTAAHMALGGYLSTEFLIGTGVYNLLRHPDQWQLLRENRSLMPQAIDEMLRYDAPFQLADRWVEKDTSLGGVTVPAKTMLAVVYGSANRDREVFPEPDRFDIGRPLRKAESELTPNLGFGDGIHRCIGEWLARPVTAAAIGALLDRFPSARIGEVGPWAADPYFRSLTKLQLLLR